MFKDLTNFKGINWWTLLAGIGLNFIITMTLAMAGIYVFEQAPTMSEFFSQNISAVMMLVVFITSIIVGFIVAKIADNVPLKHVFWASMGAAVPYLISFFMGNFSVMLIMVAVVAVAGNFNGAFLAAPRRRRSQQ